MEEMYYEGKEDHQCSISRCYGALINSMWRRFYTGNNSSSGSWLQGRRDHCCSRRLRSSYRWRRSKRRFKSWLYFHRWWKRRLHSRSLQGRKRNAGSIRIKWRSADRKMEHPGRWNSKRRSNGLSWPGMPDRICKQLWSWVLCNRSSKRISGSSVLSRNRFPGSRQRTFQYAQLLHIYFWGTLRIWCSCRP